MPPTPAKKQKDWEGTRREEHHRGRLTREHSSLGLPWWPSGCDSELPSSQAPSAGGLGSIPGQGTRSHMLQRRDPACCN